MKKIKSPWYGLAWIGVWTAALVWFLNSDMFSTRELIGLTLVYIILTSVTAWLVIQHFLRERRVSRARNAAPNTAPALNAPCPCGSGKKYKRCCGAPAESAG